MRCRKCHKAMVTATKVQRLMVSILPVLEERLKVMDGQVVMCEHCEQPYVFVRQKDKIGVFTVTPKWLARQTKEVRESMATAVESVKAGMELGQLNDYWIKKMEGITVA